MCEPKNKGLRMCKKYFHHKDIISVGGFLICLASLLYVCLNRDYYDTEGAQFMLPPMWSVFGGVIFVLLASFAALWGYNKPRRYKYLAGGFLIGCLWMFESSFYILIHMYWFGWR